MQFVIFSKWHLLNLPQQRRILGNSIPLEYQHGKGRQKALPPFIKFYDKQCAVPPLIQDIRDAGRRARAPPEPASFESTGRQRGRNEISDDGRRSGGGLRGPMRRRAVAPGAASGRGRGGRPHPAGAACRAEAVPRPAT